jgi:hypothetical protein
MSLTIDLPLELESRIRAEAEKHGQDVAEYVVTALETLLAPPARPLWQVAAGLLSDLPPEELERLPEDGSMELDHYVYGSPKSAP